MCWTGPNGLLLSCLLLHVIWFGGRSPVAVVASLPDPLDSGTHTV